MNSEEFRRLVTEMRHAQKEYFRTRSKQVLVMSKELERRVDKALNDEQKKLFPD